MDHLLRGVGQLVGQGRATLRLIEGTDVVVQKDLTVARERSGTHRLCFGVHRRSAVHQPIADVDTQQVTHGGSNVSRHRLRRHSAAVVEP